MNPQDFLGFFKTKTGRLTLFVALFGGGLILVGVARNRHAGPPDTFNPATADPATNKSQVVQTIQKPLDIFRPPPSKPESQRPSSPPPKVEKPTTASSTSDIHANLLTPISLLAETPVAEKKTLSPLYAPFGRLIPCETIITVDSASIRTPIIGLVTENIYNGGHLIIPAGTEVHGTAQPDRSRERIATSTAWRLVWQTGEELSLNAVALDREFENDNSQTGWGITDGSAGIRGELIKSDNLQEIKMFAATFLSGAAEALTEKQTTLFGTVDTPSLNNAPLKGAQQVLNTYAQRIADSIQKDGFYVRIASGKQFYLYVLQTIDRADAKIGGEDISESTNDATASALVPR
jgi:hypothetical protein